jgi:hypothetical protein
MPSTLGLASTTPGGSAQQVEAANPKSRQLGRIPE